ncbi:MAG: hypothetical protein DME02_08055 [Candidatus Rokuibacteriota bacterium]|nr:MAG: hypothetical protein DME02_08055 [Candidatus Rokubacteria bacterium]
MEELISSFPQQWQELIGLLLAPIVWIPRTQQVLMDFFMRSPSMWVTAAKCVLLLLPALLAVMALWCTQLSVYTLPFRNARVHFMSAMLLAWWDAARATWLYWTGLVRCVAVACGWMLVIVGFLVRLVVEALRTVATMPFMMTRVGQRYFQPGVPWVAFLALVLWCVLEATVFSHVLFPAVTDVLTRLAETPEPARPTGVVLFVFLLLLVMGSFACIQAMIDAARTRQLRYIAQMIAIEVFVGFFEVMFLYREIVSALLPWLAEQRAGTIVVATCGWIGVRGLTWFLFGQYGTPSMIAFLSRRPLTAEGTTRAAAMARGSWWAGPLEDFRRETEWLHAASDRMLEYLALPVLHVAAAAVNFAMIFIASRQVFDLPFKGLDEIPESRSILSGLHLQARKTG